MHNHELTPSFTITISKIVWTDSSVGRLGRSIAKIDKSLVKIQNAKGHRGDNKISQKVVDGFGRNLVDGLSNSLSFGHEILYIVYKELILLLSIQNIIHNE